MISDWVGEGIAGLAAMAINAFIGLYKLFLMSWALKPTVNINDGESAAGSVTTIQNELMTLVAVIAVCGILAASARLAWARRAEPLTNVLSGVLTLVITTFLGLFVAQTLIYLSDEISMSLVTDSVTTGALEPDSGHLENSLQVLAYAFFMLLVGSMGVFFVIAQIAFMLLRDASLIVLAGVLPLAAVGKMIPGTQWFEKITGWMLALIFYKPCAVMVMWVGFTLLEGGNEETSSAMSDKNLQEQSPEDLGFAEAEAEGVELTHLLDIAYTMTMGVLVLGLALLAMPVMVKLFDFTVGHVGGFGNPGPALASAAAGVGTAVATGGATAAAGGAAASQAGNISGALGDMSQAMEAPDQGGADGAKDGGGSGQGGGSSGGDGGEKPSGAGGGNGGGGGGGQTPPAPNGAGGGGGTPPSGGGTPPPSGDAPGGAPADGGTPTGVPGAGDPSGAPPETGQNPPGGGGGGSEGAPSTPEMPDISQAADSAAGSTHRTDE